LSPAILLAREKAPSERAMADNLVQLAASCESAFCRPLSQNVPEDWIDYVPGTKNG
jgi:hypothetical protein